MTGYTIKGLLIPSTLISVTYKHNAIIKLSEGGNRDVVSYSHITNEAAAVRLGH